MRSFFGVVAKLDTFKQSARGRMYIVQTLVVLHAPQLGFRLRQGRHVLLFTKGGFPNQRTRDEERGRSTPGRSVVFRDLAEQAPRLVKIPRVKISCGHLIGAIRSREWLRV